MIELLPFIIPPLLGALIGYVTNALAIKMLFRPLEAIRVFGVKLPFTPGILPRQRHKLADNIGRTVERELLTEETIRKRLEQDDFKKILYKAVSQYTDSLLNTNPGKISAGRIKEISIMLHTILQSEPFSIKLHSLFSVIFTSLGKKSLSQLFQIEDSAVNIRISELLSSSINSWKDQLDSMLGQRLEQAYPELMQSILHFLNQKNVRSVLESQGRIFINDAILKLNVFQRFFISAGQYDRTLHERMPEIIDDLLEQLRGLLSNEKNKAMLLELIHTNIIGFVYKPENISRLSEIVSASVKKLMDEPFSVLLHTLSGFDEAEASEKAAVLLLDYLYQIKPEKLEQGIQSLINSSNSDATISGLLSINKATKGRLDMFIRDYLLTLINEKIPEALQTLDIRTLVSERIDSLDMIDVEKIVLDVLANQLRWINVFGAFLGALIGLSQIFISLYLI